MNERIQQLAKQADGVFIHKLLTGAKQYTFLEKDLEKFAELIVRECDKYVAERWDICEPWMNPGDLLKHFGVEE